MSRAYQIRVSESVTRVVHVEDGVQTALELLPILPAERMQGLLAAELQRRGFSMDGDVAVRVEPDGIVVQVDTKAGTVTVSLQSDEEVKAEATRVESSYQQEDRGVRERLQAKAKEAVEEQVQQVTEEARQAVTAKLEARLRDLRAEIDAATNRVTGDALEEKARQLGEIEEISRDDETGAMTIRVRV